MVPYVLVMFMKPHLAMLAPSLYSSYIDFFVKSVDVVHSLMPKTALLAAFSASVPHRIHIFTGQV